MGRIRLAHRSPSRRCDGPPITRDQIAAARRVVGVGVECVLSPSRRKESFDATTPKDHSVAYERKSAGHSREWRTQSCGPASRRRARGRMQGRHGRVQEPPAADAESPRPLRHERTTGHGRSLIPGDRDVDVAKAQCDHRPMMKAVIGLLDRWRVLLSGSGTPGDTGEDAALVLARRSSWLTLTSEGGREGSAAGCCFAGAGG